MLDREVGAAKHRRAVTAELHEHEWRTDDNLMDPSWWILAAITVSKFIAELATDFLLDVRRFANAAVAESAKQPRGPDRTGPDRAGSSTSRQRYRGRRAS